MNVDPPHTACEPADKVRRRARMRAEAERLRNDPDDVAASRELAAEMAAVGVW